MIDMTGAAPDEPLEIRAPAPPTLSWLAREVDTIAAECLQCRYRRELPLAPLDCAGETARTSGRGLSNVTAEQKMVA